MRRWLAVMVGALALVCAWAASAGAVPRMSLTAGTPCSACHYNTNGGGGRTEIGWGSMAWVGAVTYDKIGLDAMAEQETNLVAGDYVTLGADIRLQIARLGRPTQQIGEDGQVNVITPDRNFIPMQIQPYLGVYATDWLTLYGSYAVGPATFQGNVCDPTYPGQACFMANAKIQPSYSAPYVRVGQMRPSIGVRYDDHTMSVWTDAAQPRTLLVPPNYAEPGAEMTYQPIYWFQTDVGAYWARNLGEIIDDPEVVGPNTPAALGRVQFSPRIDELNMTTWIGTSLYWAGRYRMENYFVGLGLLDRAALMFDVSRTDRGEAADYSTLNLMTKLAVNIKDWLIVEGRVGRATTQKQGEEFVADQIVAGVQFFPIPYLELRPEYRITRTDEYAIGQYTLQIHMFY